MMDRRSDHPNNRRGVTLPELLVAVLVIAWLLAMTIPAIARVRGDSGVMQSMSNLSILGAAHVLYAADWEGRQVTWARDDLGVFNSVADYNQAHDCDFSQDPGCHPHITAGWSCDGFLYEYFSTNPGHASWAFEPLNFEESVAGFGHFRLPFVRPFHDYVTGRMYDPVFYAPNDTVAWAAAEPFFDSSCEFDAEANPPLWPSYAMSPAAMFSPDVMRANADGGFQDPWSLDDGFASPGLFQAQYPDLKTLMIEHHWNQNAPPDPCNPDFEGFGQVYPCEPYYFNHSIDSEPVTLFYDLSVRLLPNTEALAGDQQVLMQTEGVDGLWHRGTPLGTNGYFISVGFDGTDLSHHVLTTDGILGRDTLGGLVPAAARGLSGAIPPPVPNDPPPPPPSFHRHVVPLFELISEGDKP